MFERTADRQGPLSGLLVCELSTVLAGPYCGMLLADLGARVIKVEPLEGDITRTYGPPFAGAPETGVRYQADDPRGAAGYPGESTYFLALNRNKESLRLDLRAAPGREVLERLLRRSDALIENFRPSGLQRLGFGDDRLGALNPALVHLAITGYGPIGPAADRPGFDFIAQAEAGLMSLTGRPDEEGGEPTKVGVAISDLATAMLGAVAVLGALLGRERGGTGQRIDISLLESTVAMLINQATNHLVGGMIPARMGNRHPNITPYETFVTSDGEIAIAVGSAAQWPRFCGALGVDALAADPRFATNAARVEHRDELRPLLVQRLAGDTSAAWLERLVAADVPCGPINDLAAVFRDPQVGAREMVQRVAHPTIGELPLTGVPFKLSATPGSVRRPPPLLGEHTEAVLAWLGYGEAEVAELRRVGVI